MPPRLPLGLVELSLLSLNPSRVSRVFSRAYQSASTPELPIYPSRLSLDGNQQPFQPQVQQDEEEPLKMLHQPVDEFTEEDLRAVYRDLLRLEVPEPTQSFAASIQDPAVILPRLAQRIIPRAHLAQAQVNIQGQGAGYGNDGQGNENAKLDSVLSSLSSKLQSRLSTTLIEPQTTHNSTGKPYSDLLNALQRGTVDAALPILGDSGNDASVVMTISEWNSLVQGCLQHLDFDGAFTTLRLMKRSNVQPTKELLDHVMSAMADEGLFREIQAFNAEFLTNQPSHPHLRYLLHALAKCRLYSTATTILHTVETSLSTTKPTPPSIEVYETLIDALLKSPGPGHHARVSQGWDIFYNMRYIAHPVPSISLYAKMIAACADSPSPSAFSPTFTSTNSSESSESNTSFGMTASSTVDTNRGLDLWHELTVTNRQTPTREAYNAIIHLLARSKSTAHQAYTYAQEMLDLGRDADGKPQMPLDKDTLMALSDAAKRLGDVKMARWALLNLAKLDGVNQMASRNAFHAYAAYKAPFKRDMPMNSRTRPSSFASRNVAENIETTEMLPTERRQNSLEDILLPQTSQAVLAEADALFEAILLEKTQDSTLDSALFSTVEKTQLKAIAQAYLDVYFTHSSSLIHAINKVREVHRRLLSIQEDLGYSDGRLDLMATPDMVRTCLFHCAKGKGEPEEEVKQFAMELWNAWQSMEGPAGLWGVDPSIHSGGSLEISKIRDRLVYDRKWIEDLPSTPAERARMTMLAVRSSSVAKAWGSYIHFKVRCGEVDEAITLVRSFEHKYPPSAAKTNLHSAMPVESSVSLTGPQSLVKMSQRSLVDDDSVPPLLVFTDVATLHNYLVRKERIEDINYLTWLLHTYAGAVRDRRGMNLWVGDVKAPTKGRAAGIGGEVLEIREKEEKKAKRVFDKRRRTGRLRVSLPRRG